jgi:spermidine/putrescine transport system permease protein
MQRRLSTWLLLAPAGVWFAVMLVLPLCFVLVFSFGERAAAGGYAPAFTVEQYLNLPARGTAFLNTLTLAPLGTLLSLIIAYPLAYFLALRVDPKWRTLLLILVIVPFWTSILIRSYAWIFILGGQGLPAVIDWLGFGPVRLINTPFAVLTGIVYGYLPLMVLPIYVSLERLDKRLLEAASDLGSPPLQSFVQVTLPLSLPGIATGCMLVFILLMGEFLIPAMLGGGKVFFIGNALVDLFLQSRNWAFGSAVAVTLVLIMLITVTGYMWLMRRLGGARDDVSLM